MINELRIGNWVRHNSEWCYRGEDVYEFKWELSDFQAIAECTMFPENLEPIPLTEEWLVKFGFKQGDFYWFSKKYFTDCEITCEQMSISYNVKSKRLSIFDAIEETDINNILSYPVYTAKCIYYVHDLQNLYYSLTKEEL